MSVRSEDSRDPALLRVARAHGLLTEHENGMGVRCFPSEAAIIAVLRALGVDPDRPSDAQPTSPAAGPPKRFWRDERRRLGIFAPLYAIRSERSAGVGGLEDLGRLCEWAGGLGVSLVSTLPLLSGRYATPIDGCPYAPLSRSVFSELFLDLWDAMTPTEREESARLTASPMIDYEASWQLKRGVLARESTAANPVAIETFLDADPLVAQYVRWRAEHEGGGPDAERLYGFAQLRLHEQLSALRSRAEAAGCGLYLDLPVGVTANGFDVHRTPDAYAKGIAVGAPPDAYFPEGQVWGFPPMLPEHARLSGHGELIEATRRHLRYASTLRLDHVMGLWRLYWVPEGHGADDGVYVQYDAGGALDAMAELSQEHEALFIGENLGTVPPEVDVAMIDRGLVGMTAAQYDGGDQAMAPGAAKPDLIAAPNTHDMPTFAGYLAGRDIDLRRSLRLLDASGAAFDHRIRSAAVKALHERLRVRDEAGLFDALIDRLCASPAPIVMVALEDLWAETEPQNIPGVSKGYPCWRRPMRWTLEEVIADDSIAARLRGWASGIGQRSGAGAS